VLRDTEGREYLDGLAGLWLANSGYSREEIARAAYEQMKTLSYYTLFWGWSNPPAIRLAARLAELAPPGLNRVFFTSGGSEANETSIKIARLFWEGMGRPEKDLVVTFQQAYHGVSYGAMTATGLETVWRGFSPFSEGFVRVPPPYGYRCPHGKDACDASCADALAEAFEAIGPQRVAAFLAEPIMGVGGVIVPPPGYFQRVREICGQYEVLWIADEVITGFGRTGTWFGVEHWGAIPDLISFAKGVTSGYAPLGGTLVHDRVYEGLKRVENVFNHGFTYTGHPVSCAVGLKNLEIMEREKLPERAAGLGKTLEARLRAIDSPHVGEVRGMGLLWGVELVADRATRALPDPVTIGWDVQARCRQRGVLVRGLFPGNIVALAPPLVVTEAQLDRIVSVLADSIAEAFRQAKPA